MKYIIALLLSATACQAQCYRSNVYYAPPVYTPPPTVYTQITYVPVATYVAGYIAPAHVSSAAEVSPCAKLEAKIAALEARLAAPPAMPPASVQPQAQQLPSTLTVTQIFAKHGCAKCHSAGNANQLGKGFVMFDAQGALLADIKAAIRIADQCDRGLMPKGGRPIPDDENAVVKAWLREFSN